MANADVAWIEVLPSAKGFLPALTRETGPAAKTAGSQAGQDFGRAFGSSSVDAVQRANTAMSAALRKTADAAGQVRVAEAKLNDLRSSGKATAGQLAAAEERLASARRKEQGANSELAASSGRLRAAQDQHTDSIRRGGVAVDETNRKAGLLSRTFGTMHGAVLGGFAAFAAADTAVRFIGGAINAASDLGEQTSKVGVVFEGSAKQVIDFSKTTASSLGISQVAALTSAGTFGNLFRAIGIVPQASADMSVQLVKSAADLASFNNASPEEVLEAMRAGLVGETEPLRKFGINISDAAMRQELLNQGVKLSSGPLTAAQKAQAAYGLILKQSSLASGDFERTSGSLANQQRILSAEWDDAKAKLGALLLGPMTAVVTWATTSFLPKVGGAFDTIKTGVDAFVTGFSKGAGAVSGSGGQMAQILGNVGSVASGLWTILKTGAGILAEVGGWILKNVQWIGPLAGLITGVVAAARIWVAVQLLLNTAVAANPIGFLIASIRLLVVGFGIAYASSETFRKIVDAALRAVGAAGVWMWENAIKPAWAGIQAAWSAMQTAAGVLWRLLQQAFQAIGQAWDAMVSAVRTLWTSVLQPVWEAIKAAGVVLLNILKIVVFGPIVIAWKLLTEAIQLAWNAVLKPTWALIQTAAVYMWTNVLKPTWALIQAAWSALLDLIKAIWERVLRPTWDAIQAAAQFMWDRVLKPTWAAVQQGWDVLVSAMKAVWDRVLYPMWQAVQRAMEFLWNNILRPIWDAVNKAWDALVSGMKSAYDRFLAPVWELIQTAVGAVKKAFDTAVEGIRTAWDKLKGIAAAPVNFVVRTVLRDGLFKAWNWLLDQLGITTWHVDTGASWLQGIPGYARGGTIGGHSPTPTADNIPIWATAGEFMIRQPIAQQTSSFLTALNAGEKTAVEAARTWGRYATGGQIYAFTKAAFPRAKVNSTYRPGAPDYHGSNNAADMGEAGFSGGAGRPYIASMKQWWYDNFGKSAEEIIYTGIGNSRPQVKNGADHAYSSFINATHTNHLHVAETGPLGGAVGAPTGGATAMEPPWWQGLWSTVTGAFDWLKGKMGNLDAITGGPMGQWIKELPLRLVGGMWDKVKGSIGTAIATYASAIAAGFTDTGDTSSASGAKSQVQGVASLPSFGWGSGGQWDALVRLVQGESSWNPRAENPTTTASGLFQFIDSTWNAYKGTGVAATHAADARVVDQAAAGMRYIREVYGTPANAYKIWSSRSPHWYGQGGSILPVFHRGGTTRGWRHDSPAILGPDERVLRPREDDYFRRFVDAVERDGGTGVGKRQMAEHMHFHQQPGEDSLAFANRLWHKLRVADRGGVHATTFVS